MNAEFKKQLKALIGDSEPVRDFYPNKRLLLLLFCFGMCLGFLIRAFGHIGGIIVALILLCAAFQIQFIPATELEEIGKTALIFALLGLLAGVL